MIHVSEGYRKLPTEVCIEFSDYGATIVSKLSLCFIPVDH